MVIKKAPLMIKPSKQPQGAKGKPYNRPSPMGNAPLLPTAPPPEGEVLAALCLELLMSPKAERRVDFPLRVEVPRSGDRGAFPSGAAWSACLPLACT